MLLAAAQAKHQAGALVAALGLVATAESGPLDEFQRAQADVLRAQISFASSRGSDAPPLLLKAAKRLEPLDARLARETYLDALSAAVFAAVWPAGAVRWRRPRPLVARTCRRSLRGRPIFSSMG